MKTRALGICLALLVSPLLIAAAPAANASVPCMHRYELRELRYGMSRRHIERVIFHDTKSWLAEHSRREAIRTYMSCDRHHAGWVRYRRVWRGGHVVRNFYDGWHNWTSAS